MNGQQDSRVLDDAIGQTRAAFVEALEGGDAPAAAALYADTARLLPPSAEPMEGRRAIEAFWQAGIDSGIAEVELESRELRGFDGIAYEIGRYALRLRNADGGMVVDSGHYLLLHARQPDGTWRRAVEMFSPGAPPATTRSLPAEQRQRAPLQRDCNAAASGSPSMSKGGFA